MQTNPMSAAITAGLCWIAAPLASLAVTLEKSFIVERVSANRNETNVVRGEVDYIASRMAPTGEGIAVSIEEDWPEDAVIKVKLSAPDLQETQGEKILSAVERYIYLRFAGHSREFSTYLILHGNDPWPTDLEKSIDRAASLKQEIAFPWIRPEVHQPVAFPTQRESERYSVLYVVDGAIAWAYLIPKGAGQVDPDTIIEFRFDAIEFSPAVSEVIRKVFEELKHENRVPTPEKLPGASWWFELRERIKQKSGLQWRTPVELNPEVQFD